MPSRRIVLLGPQRLSPTLNRAVAELGVAGRIAAVTAGWEEREAEDQELSDHLGGRVLNLAVYNRVEEILRRDPELRAGIQARRSATRAVQELYRLQLAHALDAARALLAPRDEHPRLLEPERTAAIEAVRRLDEHHVRRMAEVHAEFEEHYRPRERPHVARHHADLARILAGTSALCIAGGHVAILRSRLWLLDVLPLSGEQPLFAWSAGAMAISERIVLFHDSPPQGAGNAEVLEPGLGVARGIIPLPHAQKRLQLEDSARVALFARRFDPALCVALDPNTRLDGIDGGWRGAPGTKRLSVSGQLEEVSAVQEAGAP